jgi:CRISPR/Cas system-associated exonuclease Cas4 (RecB family)
LEKNEIISSGLLELYVLGKTNDQETAQVLAWKATYPEVAAELLAIEDSLEQYDLAKAVSPYLDTKKNLFASIKKTSTTNTLPTTTPTAVTSNDNVVAMNTAPVRNINSNLKYAVAASIALLIGSAIFIMVTYTKYNKANSDLAAAQQKNNKANSDLAAAQQKINTQSEDITALQKSLEVPLNNSSQQVVLKGTATAPNSTAKIFWIRNTGDVYVEASGLPEAPQGSQYQLWAIIDGKPVDAGMIIYNKKGQKYNIQKMKTFGKAQAFAITLEKEGGSPTPTMEKLYVMSEI